MTDQDRFAEILWGLKDDGVLGADVGEDHSIQIDRLPQGVAALYLDLKVRSSDGFGGTADQIIGLVELADRLWRSDELPKYPGRWRGGYRLLRRLSLGRR